MSEHAAYPPPCHPDCDLGPDVDHAGYLGYRCVDTHGCSLPFPGEDHPGCFLSPEATTTPPDAAHAAPDESDPERTES